MEVSKAAEDILNNPRFEGAIDTIKGVTQWTDVGFATVITFVAFMIICVAMLKNVLAGAYCAYPKFWDHVNEAHKNKQGKGLIQQTVSMFQGGLQGVTGGAGGGQSIGDIIYGIIPDVKHMTDFEEGGFSAKHYFMEAIPQMLVCVALGAFIYNGTYRDVAALWVNTGTTIINRTLLEFDPIAMFDNFTGTAGRPVFGSDNGVDQFTQNQNVIATNLYTQIIGTYKDIKSAEQKRLLADACDREAERLLNAMRADGAVSGSWGQIVCMDPGVSGKTAYAMKHSSTWGSTDMSDACAKRVGKVGENPNKYQFAYCSSLATMGIENISSESHPEHGFVVHMLQFTEGGKDVNTQSANDLVLTISSGSGVNVAISNITANVWFETGYSSGFAGLDKAILYMTNGTDSGHRMLMLKNNTGMTDGQVYQLDSPLTVTYTTDDGITETHKIAAIKYSSSGAGTIESPQLSGWKFSANASLPSGFQTYADALNSSGSAAAASPAPSSTTP